MTPKERRTQRNMDTAFLRGVRDRLKDVPKEKTTYRIDEVNLRRCHSVGWEYAKSFPDEAEVMMAWRGWS